MTDTWTPTPVTPGAWNTGGVDADAVFLAQAQAALGLLNDGIAEIQGQIGDITASQDAAYAAQASALAAAASQLDTRIARAMQFPSDFGQGTEYWVNGNGQIAAPSVASNSPLPGTFPIVAGVGVVYQTESDTESCNSFGPVGYIAGVPGTRIRIIAKVQCVRDDTSGQAGVKVGVSILPLNGDFSLAQYAPGQAITGLTVSQGWQLIEYDIVAPTANCPAFYRPTVFYNVNGNTPDPLHPDNSVQGNGQYQVSYVAISVQKPGDDFAPNLTFLYGSGAYATPQGCNYLRVTLVGGQGGMHGQGMNAGEGAAGNPTTFGGYQAQGGGAAQAGDLNIYIVTAPSTSYAYQQGYGGNGGSGGTFDQVTVDSTGKATVTPVAGAAGENGRYGSITVEAF